MKYYGKPSLNKVFENGLPGQNFPRDLHKGYKCALAHASNILHLPVACTTLQLYTLSCTSLCKMLRVKLRYSLDMVRALHWNREPSVRLHFHNSMVRPKHVKKYIRNFHLQKQALSIYLLNTAIVRTGNTRRTRILYLRCNILLHCSSFLYTNILIYNIQISQGERNVVGYFLGNLQLINFISRQSEVGHNISQYIPQNIS